MDPIAERVDRIERGLLTLYRRTATNSALLRHLETRAREIRMLLWVADLLWSLFRGTLFLSVFCTAYAWPLMVMAAIAILGGYVRRYVIENLFKAILELMKVLIDDIYDSIAKAIRFLADPLGGIGHVLGIGPKHKKKGPIPVVYTKDLLGEEWMSLLHDAIGFCEGRTKGLQYIWGMAMRYASPSMCFACKTLSLSSTTRWICEPVFFGSGMYDYRQSACHVRSSDIACQVIYVDVLVTQILIITCVGLVVFAYERVFVDVMQMLLALLRTLMHTLHTAVRMLFVSDSRARARMLFAYRKRWRAHIAPHVPGNIARHYHHALRTPLTLPPN